MFSAFALGASVAAPAAVVLERGVATAVVACVIAGIVALFSGLAPGKARAGARRQ